MSLGIRDHAKSHFIINQMMRNVKDHPPLLIVFQLFSFFSKVYRVQSKRLSNEYDVSKELGNRSIHRPAVCNRSQKLYFPGPVPEPNLTSWRLTCS